MRKANPWWGVGGQWAHSLYEERKRRVALFYWLILSRLMIMFIGCFVDYMLERLGCGHAWRGRMAECISSTLFSILVDGSPTRFFKASWGFGWGHPFSPFLFTLIEDFFWFVALKQVWDTSLLVTFILQIIGSFFSRGWWSEVGVTKRSFVGKTKPLRWTRTQDYTTTALCTIQQL